METPNQKELTNYPPRIELEEVDEIVQKFYKDFKSIAEKHEIGYNIIMNLIPQTEVSKKGTLSYEDIDDLIHIHEKYGENDVAKTLSYQTHEHGRVFTYYGRV